MKVFILSSVTAIMSPIDMGLNFDFYFTLDMGGGGAKYEYFEELTQNDTF